MALIINSQNYSSRMFSKTGLVLRSCPSSSSTSIHSEGFHMLYWIGWRQGREPWQNLAWEGQTNTSNIPDRTSKSWLLWYYVHLFFFFFFFWKSPSSSANGEYSSGNLHCIIPLNLLFPWTIPQSGGEVAVGCPRLHLPPPSLQGLVTLGPWPASASQVPRTVPSAHSSSQ